MPEYLYALLQILFLTTAFFAFADKSISSIIEREHFILRRNAWFGLTLAAFLTQNYWLYALIAIPLIIYVNRRETNPSALFFFILFALPTGTIQVPGGGLVNFLFELSHARMLALVILLPAYFFLIRQSDTLPIGRTTADKVLIIYLLLYVILYLRGTTITDALRVTFYQFIDVFLPYFVISRSLKNIHIFKDTLLSLVLAIMILAPIAIVESLRDWLFYRNVISGLGLEGAMTGNLGRDGMLRVSTTVGHPIALGYLMVVGIGFYLFFQGSIQSKYIRRLGMTLLIAGLIAPISRGPWMGACLLFIVFIATGRNSGRRLMGSALTVILALLLIAELPGGERVTNLLPFIGKTEEENVDYRKTLVDTSIVVMKKNPWFGSINFLEEPEMQVLVEGGGGKIDIVNTYIGVALTQGYVGLGLFIGFFALIVSGVYRAMRSIADNESEEYLLGRVLLSTLLAILFIIFTVSSITIIPIVYWSVAGLGVAYTQMVRKSSENNALMVRAQLNTR